MNLQDANVIRNTMRQIWKAMKSSVHQCQSIREDIDSWLKGTERSNPTSGSMKNYDIAILEKPRPELRLKSAEKVS